MTTGHITVSRVTVKVRGPANATISVSLEGESSQSAQVDIPAGKSDIEHGFATDKAASSVIVTVIKDGRTLTAHAPNEPGISRLDISFTLP